MFVPYELSNSLSDSQTFNKYFPSSKRQLCILGSHEGHRLRRSPSPYQIGPLGGGKVHKEEDPAKQPDPFQLHAG